MNSRERMLAALEYKEVDYTPCSFMLFHNLARQCGTETEFVQRQVELGLDAYAHVGRLKHSLHPQAKEYKWVEREKAGWCYCRRIETPKGPLTQRVQQREGWPIVNYFPVFDDLIVGRAVEVLVKPEEDLEKLRYVFGPFRDEHIQELRDSAEQARKIANRYGLIQVGGWSGSITNNTHWDSGVMGCDCMAWLSGYQEVMTLSLEKPELIKEYAQIIHEWNIQQIEIYLDVTEAEVIWRRGWYETAEFWTPQSYAQIIAPTIKREAEIVHQAGRKYGYIITSVFLPLLDHILDADIDVLVGIDPEQGKGTDLALVKEKFHIRGKALWGGVSGAVTIELGTEADTKKAVKTALNVLSKGGGLILSPVDNIRENTPNAWRNTQAFINAWKGQRAEVR